MAVDEQKAKPGKTKLVAAILLACVIGVTAFVVRRTQAAKTQDESAQRVVAVLHLENFVVNLSDQDQNSFLRVGIDLGITHAAPKAGRENPWTEQVPVVRDTILSVLSSFTSDELLTAAGKTRLKDQLLKSLQSRVPTLGVQEVYFTEFLVQR